MDVYLTILNTYNTTFIYEKILQVGAFRINFLRIKCHETEPEYLGISKEKLPIE